ncbi:Methylthioribulose-1-phosphate dehydratase [Planctomycetes bacterium Pan216]|uniref:Methylthioribulose-1-phosphate dehydratase n=1 Tax=Kolteria novifilia TaxID=2527975 RepID=A0A518B9M1_9BACT|nr:Methylthioribulose-1-phosphate dehydratase [Planctomycetes bacterium Pan216]
MINEWQARQQIIEVGRRLYQKGFAAANDGNISVRIDEDRFLCTPTGVSKGFMKPEDLCIVDGQGNQVAGEKKRTSEIKLHLSIYRTSDEVNGVVHCHPPHATAFAIVHEPVPKCILPEVEVFLGEVPLVKYETPGTQDFAETVVPYVHDSNTAILANHGTVAWHKDLMTAYFNTEIIDAYCRMLILARQLGTINYLGERQVGELLALKKRLGIHDPRLEMDDCDLCGNSIFREGYTEFAPDNKAFPPPEACSCSGTSPRAERKLPEVDLGSPATTAPSVPSDPEALVKLITEQVMKVLGNLPAGAVGANGSY